MTQVCALTATAPDRYIQVYIYQMVLEVGR